MENSNVDLNVLSEKVATVIALLKKKHSKSEEKEAALKQLEELALLIKILSKQNIQRIENNEYSKVKEMVLKVIKEVDTAAITPKLSNWEIGFTQTSKLTPIHGLTAFWKTKNDIAKEVVKEILELKEHNSQVALIKYAGAEEDLVDCIVLRYKVDYSK